ncbi:MAG: FkbM family methyltransferase [Bacteroidota bacterium]
MKQRIKLLLTELMYRVNETLFSGYYKKFIDLLEPNILGVEKIGLGKQGDGTYVIPRHFIKKDCTLLSFGIADDISFEEDFSKTFKSSKIFAFDPTVDAIPKTSRTISFHKIGLAAKRNKKWNLYSFDEILKDLKINSQGQLILKMDIEGWEWGALESLDYRNLDIPVITAEFHATVMNSRLEMLFFPYFFVQRYFIFKKLLKEYYLFHLHANNYRYTNFGNFHFPWYWEATLVKKSLFIGSIAKDVRSFNKSSFENNADYQFPFLVHKD